MTSRRPGAREESVRAGCGEDALDQRALTIASGREVGPHVRPNAVETPGTLATLGGDDTVSAQMVTDMAMSADDCARYRTPRRPRPGQSPLSAAPYRRPDVTTQRRWRVRRWRVAPARRAAAHPPPPPTWASFGQCSRVRASAPVAREIYARSGLPLWGPTPSHRPRRPGRSSLAMGTAGDALPSPSALAS